ncbi:MAG: nitroreductase family protein [Thermoproteota archaeon]
MDLFEAIKDRRSVRSFKQKPVPENLIKKILEAASLAPSAGNLQAWEFIIIKDSVTKMEISKAAFYQSFIAEAPVDVVVCANQKRSSERYGRRGRDLYSICDASAATQNLLLAAHALGLGSCWVGAFDETSVSKILGLPDGVKPIAIVPIGYAGETPSPRSRIPLREIVHMQRYGTKLDQKGTGESEP